ncbi:MAG: peptidylprolyl isomerase [Nonlabens sp.]
MKSLNAVLKLFIFLSVAAVSAQGLEDKTLLTIDGVDYDAGTFMKVYQKNLDIVQDESQKDIDNYLELYIKYRLKLQQAYELGLEKDEEYKKELKNYRSSLAQGYLTDTEVTDELVKQAFDRSLEEVNASHILVKVGKGATPEDTLKAYNRALEIKKELDQGADFATIARNKSEGPSAGNEGELGWFGPFRMVYEFEDAAYSTPVGEYTEPFRTDFGYHILKVNERRKSRGEVTVAHIMTFDKPADSTKTAEKRINEINEQLKSGKSFEELAREFSDDLRSADKGGELQKFGTGGLNSPIFVDTALEMEDIGSYSEPFESKYGWHIIKLLEKHPVKSFEEQEKLLRDKITKSPRARKITKSFIEKLKTKYDINADLALSDSMLEVVGDSIMQKAWKYEPKDLHEDEVLFSIMDSTYTARDFYEFAEQRQMKDYAEYSNKREKLEGILDSFEETSIIDYYDQNLERDNDDFAFVYREFKEGILLFNLMEKKIWGKAKEDTVALKSYYEDHKHDYRWKRRLDLVLTQNTSQEVAVQVQDLLRKGVAVDSIKSQLNVEGRTKSIISSGTVEENYNRLPENFDIKKGVSKIYHDEGDSFYKVILVKEIMEPSIKSFEEATGAVINNYQQVLEKQWEESLEEGHKIKINKRTLKKVKNQLAKEVK